MTPTQYELLESNGVIYLRFYAREAAKGYVNVQAIRKMTGKSLAGLRKEGTNLAKRFRVPFIDRTNGVAA